MSNKKYTLYRAEGDSNPPCAFFLSPEGCRNGNKCKFAHVMPNTDPPQVSSANSISSSDISSESEGDNPTNIPIISSNVDDSEDPFISGSGGLPTTPTPTTPTPQQKNKRKRTPIEEDPFRDPHKDTSLPAKTKIPSSKKSSNKKKLRRLPKQKNSLLKKNKAAENQCLSDLKLPIASFSLSSRVAGIPNTCLTTSTAKETSNPFNSKKQKTAVESQSFRDLKLPIASFSLNSKGAGTPNLSLTSTNTKETITFDYKDVVPKSTPEGMKWQNAVLSTRENRKYQSYFNFDNIKKAEEEKGLGKESQWIRTKPFGSWCAKNPHAIAIDCEMCETKDPASGVSDHKALCRLSVVNAVNPDEVLIDTLVKPVWPVKDHRTRINGIKNEHLEDVKFTLEHAQAFMKSLCSSETVIVGHAVHNDLGALRMEHYCLADSALLFKVKDNENATCSLKDLAKCVLKREMPQVHDSVNDARVALLCLEEGYLKTGGKPEPIISSCEKSKNSELFVHRIPKGLKPEHIQNLFIKYASIHPVEIGPIEFNSDTGKSTVKFSSHKHAQLAFTALEGDERPDKTGRMQKRVYLRTGGYINVRLMTTTIKRS